VAGIACGSEEGTGQLEAEEGQEECDEGPRNMRGMRNVGGRARGGHEEQHEELRSSARSMRSRRGAC